MKITGTQVNEMRQKAEKLFDDVSEVLTNETATAEERVEAFKKKDEAMALAERIDSLVTIKEAMQGLEQINAKQVGDQPAAKFQKLGHFLQAVYASTFQSRYDPRLKTWNDPNEPSSPAKVNAQGWIEAKDLEEAIGASGGFLVPVEQREELLVHEGTQLVVRPRATIIPMRRRSVLIPVLDQTGTVAGQPHWWGGVLARWTEERGLKEETQPAFKQINLVAHKLVTYTEASDELLADSAISLEALLSQFFSQVIDWEEEFAFVQGSGAGQPLGVITAVGQPTIVVAPVAANALAVTDFANMLMSFMGNNPVWMMSRRWMARLIELNGPANNPSYVFIPGSVVNNVPSTLFGYPIFFSEMMPLPGVQGSVLLADWSKYLIGDRQATTIDSSKHFRFQNDLTAWRATHRVDGQPWLSAPLSYQDGTTSVSPFVILGSGVVT